MTKTHWIRFTRTVAAASAAALLCLGAVGCDDADDEPADATSTAGDATSTTGDVTTSTTAEDMATNTAADTSTTEGDTSTTDPTDTNDPGDTTDPGDTAVDMAEDMMGGCPSGTVADGDLCIEDNADCVTSGATEVSFAAEVAPIFSNSCSGCHGWTNDFGGLTGKTSNCYDVGLPVIIPHDVEGSFVLNKVQPGPACGGQMPASGPDLTANQIDTIRQWICQGAMDN